MIIDRTFLAEHLKAYRKALRNGCKPEYSKGMFGYCWRCTCPDNRHGIDQQCSDLAAVNQ